MTDEVTSAVVDVLVPGLDDFDEAMAVDDTTALVTHKVVAAVVEVLALGQGDFDEAIGVDETKALVTYEVVAAVGDALTLLKLTSISSQPGEILPL